MGLDRAWGSEDDLSESFEMTALLDAAYFAADPSHPHSRVYWFKAARILRRRLGRLATLNILRAATPKANTLRRLCVSKRLPLDHADPALERQKSTSSRDAVVGSAVLAYTRTDIPLRRAYELVSKELDWAKHGLRRLQPDGVKKAYKSFREEQMLLASIRLEEPDPDLWKPSGRPRGSRSVNR